MLQEKKSMKKWAQRMFAAVLALAVAVTLAAPASVQAASKAKMKNQSFWEGITEEIVIDNYPAKAKVVSVKSSKPGVIKVVGKGKDLGDHLLELKKPGKSKITVKYKVGKKTTTLSAVYTVKKYPNPYKSIQVNGEDLDIKNNPFFTRKNGYKESTATIKVNPKSGWKIKEILSSDIGSYDMKKVKTKNGQAFKIPEKGIRINFILVNKKKEKIGYNFIFSREEL